MLASALKGWGPQMIIRARILLALLLAALATAPALALKGDVLPAKGKNILIWSPAEQQAGYRRMNEVYATRLIKRGGRVHPLPRAKGPAFNPTFTERGVTYTVGSMMSANHISGLLVMKDGQIVLERYGMGRTEKDPWVSFSIAKSVTSTLIGAAVKDGFIKSIDEPVVKYVPDLAGSAYEGVSIRQLITMTSGVRWNENYADPTSDVGKVVSSLPATPGKNGIVTYMAGLPRQAPPGSRFLYNTGDTDIAGVLLRNATGKTPSQYLSEKIWKPYGMERDANWMLDDWGQEHGGCCISMTLRDYGRFGQFMVEGAGGILPDGWIQAATTNQVPIPTGGRGQQYGFFWWPRPNGHYEAQGIKGQVIHIDPVQQIVVVINSAIPNEGPPGGGKQAFINAVIEAYTTKF